MDADLTCKEFDGFLADYLSGELAQDVRANFEHHLDLCPQCVDYLATYRDSIRLGQKAFEQEQPPAVPEQLIAAILAARRAEQASADGVGEEQTPDQ